MLSFKRLYYLAAVALRGLSRATVRDIFSGGDKKAEIKVTVPKKTLFVKHESKNFEESFDLAFNSMVNQIKRQKEKTIA